MPILEKEDDIYPSDLLSNQELLDRSTHQWYCIYTPARREKDLMRRLVSMQIAFYGPVIPKRYRSPSGRLRTSYIPLFPNYVFMLADEDERHKSMTTNCVSQYRVVEDGDELASNLLVIQLAVKSGLPLTPEAKLESGQRVRVRSGPFQGYEGEVIRREGKTRLLLAVNFLEQGVSMEIDEGLLSPV